MLKPHPLKVNGRRSARSRLPARKKPGAKPCHSPQRSPSARWDHCPTTVPRARPPCVRQEHPVPTGAGIRQGAGPDGGCTIAADARRDRRRIRICRCRCSSDDAAGDKSGTPPPAAVVVAIIRVASVVGITSAIIATIIAGDAAVIRSADTISGTSDRGRSEVSPTGPGRDPLPRKSPPAIPTREPLTPPRGIYILEPPPKPPPRKPPPPPPTRLRQHAHLRLQSLLRGRHAGPRQHSGSEERLLREHPEPREFCSSTSSLTLARRTAPHGRTIMSGTHCDRIWRTCLIVHDKRLAFWETDARELSAQTRTGSVISGPRSQATRASLKSASLDAENRVHFSARCASPGGASWSVPCRLRDDHVRTDRSMGLTGRRNLKGGGVVCEAAALSAPRVSAAPRRRGLPGPAPEGAGERTELGVFQDSRDLAQRHVGVFQQPARDLEADSGSPPAGTRDLRCAGAGSRCGDASRRSGRPW